MIVYEIARSFKMHRTGIHPLAPVDPTSRLPCKPTDGSYRRRM